MQKHRLQKLEKAANHLFPNGAELLRQMAALPDEARPQWLSGLTDAELDAYSAALYGAEEEGDGSWRRNLWKSLTDEELGQVDKGDIGPLIARGYSEQEIRERLGL